jgi:hypothetical protein
MFCHARAKIITFVEINIVVSWRFRRLIDQPIIHSGPHIMFMPACVKTITFV